MDAHLNSQAVGQEFDKWLDWNGTADETNLQLPHPPAEQFTKDTVRPSLLPISPVSTSHNDSLIKTSPLTALPIYDLPTPSNSSGSPETMSSSNLRLSGDTLRDDVSTYKPNKLKRKLSIADQLESEYQQVPNRPSGSKRPHNVIEKRYRANLNEKIAELRDSVPALRALKKTKGKNEGNTSSGEEDLDGLAPSNKLNKASVLTKAVEYIRHLEFRTKKLEEENKSLKERLQILDRVIAEGGDDAKRTTAFTSDNIIEPSPSNSKDESAAAAREEPKGLIGLPESFRRMRAAESQEHYGHVYASPSERSRFGGKWPTRIMIGSLAGLMVMEGFSEPESGDRSKEKALFGIPLEILDGWAFLRSPRLYLATFIEYCRAGGVIPMIKGFMALSILAFLVFAYMFNSKPTPKKYTERTDLNASEPARPASPREVRRRAWSTSMQALQLPHHHFFQEWLAITSEWIKYSIRYWIGPFAYAWLTGSSTEDEVARIKAWDIAIDAQLAGGDVEVSRSRTVLTIFGSGTLPNTPLRLMLKAIHTRVVLWNVGLPDTLTSKIANIIATRIADRQWRRARQIHETLPARDRDRLPGYLNYLLQMDCDEVFTEVVTQRAYNLMYDRPTSEYAEDPLMDVVVEDHAIRSPLDAIAAWRSTSALEDALAAALQTPDASDSLREHVQAALEIAPPGSATESRALAVHAVLSPGRRRAFYLRAAEAIASSPDPIMDTAFDVMPATPTLQLDERVPFFIDSSTPLSARPEIATCLECARVMLKVEHDHDVQTAISLLSNIVWPETQSHPANSASKPSILSAACLYFVMNRLIAASNSTSKSNLRAQCTAFAQQLYCYLISEATILSSRNVSAYTSTTYPSLTPSKPMSTTLNLNAAIDVLYRNFDISSPSSPNRTFSRPLSRRHSSVSNDTGYGSLEDDESSTALKIEIKNMQMTPVSSPLSSNEVTSSITITV